MELIGRNSIPYLYITFFGYTKSISNSLRHHIEEFLRIPMKPKNLRLQISRKVFILSLDRPKHIIPNKNNSSKVTRQRRSYLVSPVQYSINNTCSNYIRLIPFI